MNESKEGILTGFDNEVNERCMLIRTQCDNLITSIRGSFDIALIGIPEPVKKMPLRQLMEEYNGDIIAASLKNNQRIKNKKSAEKLGSSVPGRRAE